jgi:hypothetical protein
LTTFPGISVAQAVGQVLMRLAVRIMAKVMIRKAEAVLLLMARVLVTIVLTVDTRLVGNPEDILVTSSVNY